MLAVTGIRSNIVKELRGLLPDGEEVAGFPLQPADIALCDRYFLCAGVLRAKQLGEQTDEEIVEGLMVNAIGPMRLCDRILATNDKARIVVMGSQSGFAWSYDGTYAAAKAALHRYVETKKLGPHQQLVCVAPSIIADTGMTERREDKDNLARREREHPKQRFLKAVEVARLVHFLLYVDEGYVSNTVVRMNGGGS
jgi:NAD(P)-dependent dehydrogenase (short-subunit alcohol dehydrogenase family)